MSPFLFINLLIRIAPPLLLPGRSGTYRLEKLKNFYTNGDDEGGGSPGQAVLGFGGSAVSVIGHGYPCDLYQKKRPGACPAFNLSF